MGRAGSNREYEYIKQYAVPNDQLPHIAITERVMNKIYTGGSEQVQGVRRLKSLKNLKLLNSLNLSQSLNPLNRLKSANRLSIAIAMLAFILLTTVSVYAATEIIQIRNQAGEIKLESSVMEASPQSVQISKSLEDRYREQVLEKLQPGDVLAYYYNDNTSSPGIKFLYDTNISVSYHALLGQMEQKSAPILKEPTHMPDGFQFSYGNVEPILPNPYDAKTSAEYTRLLEVFQANKGAADNQKLFMERVLWTKANATNLVYKNGEMTIAFKAAHSVLEMELAFSSEYKQEKRLVGDAEVIYAHTSNDHYFDQKAAWYDESQDIFYTINASGKGQLSSEQFISIVKGMIVK